jgi:hypothetical protein
MNSINPSGMSAIPKFSLHRPRFAFNIGNVITTSLKVCFLEATSSEIKQMFG